MNVMKRAWEIAKAAVVQFGGKVKEYFAASLKQAWAEARIMLQSFMPFPEKKVRDGVAVTKVSTIPTNLIGSDKQIAWAKQIRAEFNCDVHNAMATANAKGRLTATFFMDVMDVARKFFFVNTDAAFWINNRDNNIMQLLAQFRKTL